jgi:hypothetical protein
LSSRFTAADLLLLGEEGLRVRTFAITPLFTKGLMCVHDESKLFCIRRITKTELPEAWISRAVLEGVNALTLATNSETLGAHGGNLS